MAFEVERFSVPLDGPPVQVSDSYELLVGYLDWYRETLERKLSGLNETQLRTPLEPFGWSPISLVKHLGWVERRWLRWGFAAEAVSPCLPGGDSVEWEIPADLPTTEVLATYRDEVRRGKEAIAGAPLTQIARVGGRFPTEADAPSLSRILFHLLQEYSRHVGQLDVVRELIDGQTGE